MSKAALIDLLHDFVVRSVGEAATVEERLVELRKSANVILTLRNDRLLKQHEVSSPVGQCPSGAV